MIRKWDEKGISACREDFKSGEFPDRHEDQNDRVKFGMELIILPPIADFLRFARFIPVYKSCGSLSLSVSLLKDNHLTEGADLVEIFPGFRSCFLKGINGFIEQYRETDFFFISSYIISSIHLSLLSEVCGNFEHSIQGASRYSRWAIFEEPHE